MRSSETDNNHSIYRILMRLILGNGEQPMALYTVNNSVNRLQNQNINNMFNENMNRKIFHLSTNN